MNIAFKACMAMAGIGGSITGVVVARLLLHHFDATNVLLAGLAVVFVTASRWMFLVGKAELWRGRR